MGSPGGSSSRTSKIFTGRQPQTNPYHCLQKQTLSCPGLPGLHDIRKAKNTKMPAVIGSDSEPSSPTGFPGPLPAISILRAITGQPGSCFPLMIQSGYLQMHTG